MRSSRIPSLNTTGKRWPGVNKTRATPVAVGGISWQRPGGVDFRGVCEASLRGDDRVTDLNGCDG